MPSPSEIAKGLTKAQQRSVLCRSPEWCCSWNMQAHGALERKGLVEHISGNCGRLTPIGLAVRDILKEQDNA